MVDEPINSCSNILNSSVSKTVNWESNLSTPQISEEYDQRKNVKKELDEQPADAKKQLYENYNSFKSSNKFLPYGNKTQATTPTQWAKGTPLIAGIPCFRELMKTDCQKQSRIQLKSGFSEEPL